MLYWRFDWRLIPVKIDKKMTNFEFSRWIRRSDLTVSDLLWILEMTDFGEKNLHLIYHSLFCYRSKRFSCTFTSHCPSKLVEILQTSSWSQYTPVWRNGSHWSLGHKNFKRLERIGTVRFGYIFLITWTSKTYDDISKTEHHQVRPALHTRGENDENLAISWVDHLCHDNLALGVPERLKSWIR